MRIGLWYVCGFLIPQLAFYLSLVYLWRRSNMRFARPAHENSTEMMAKVYKR